MVCASSGVLVPVVTSTLLTSSPALSRKIYPLTLDGVAVFSFGVGSGSVQPKTIIKNGMVKKTEMKYLVDIINPFPSMNILIFYKHYC